MDGKKNFFFVGGTPRSGSTILQALLGQNPAIHSSTTSGVLGMILNVRNFWHEMPEFRALCEEETEKKKLGVLRGMLTGFYKNVAQDNVADKCRGWLSEMELAMRLLNGEPKVLVPVRDIRDVLCSFEKLYRKTKDTRQLDFEKQFPVQAQTMEGRMALWLEPGGMVGSCVCRIRDAVTRGWKKQMLFVEYDKLTAKPNETFREIYSFLKLPFFEHSFDRIEPVGDENDLAYGWKDLHKIRATLAPQEPSWPQMMPEAMAKAYEPDAFFWRNL